MDSSLSLPTRLRRFGKLRASAHRAQGRKSQCSRNDKVRPRPADRNLSLNMFTASTLSAFLSILLVHYASPTAAGASYSLTKSYEGSTFFETDNWSWGGNQTYDSTTNGDVLWANTSHTPALTYVNDAGNAIIKVDNSCKSGSELVRACWLSDSHRGI